MSLALHMVLRRDPLTSAHLPCSPHVALQTHWVPVSSSLRPAEPRSRHGRPLGQEWAPFSALFLLWIFVFSQMSAKSCMTLSVLGFEDFPCFFKCFESLLPRRLVPVVCPQDGDCWALLGHWAPVVPDGWEPGLSTQPGGPLCVRCVWGGALGSRTQHWSPRLLLPCMATAPY